MKKTFLQKDVLAGSEAVYLFIFFISWALAAFQFLDLTQAAGLLERGICPSQCLYLNTGQHKHRINTYKHQTSMPSVGFAPTITASERAKTVHASDQAAAVTGEVVYY
jgi:hypothetical protein